MVIFVLISLYIKWLVKGNVLWNVLLFVIVFWFLNVWYMDKDCVSLFINMKRLMVLYV